MENSNKREYIPYNEETFDFGFYSSAMRRINFIRNGLALADALFIVVCIIFTIISISYSGFAALIYMLRAFVMAAEIVAGTMFRLNKKVIIGSAAVTVFITVFSLVTGLSNIYSLIMHLFMVISAVLYMYLGLSEQPFAEKPGYPYFNAQAYEMSHKKEYIPDHKIYESRGTSMDGISIDDIDKNSVHELNQTAGSMDEISLDDIMK